MPPRRRPGNGARPWHASGTGTPSPGEASTEDLETARWTGGRLVADRVAPPRLDSEASPCSRSSRLCCSLSRCSASWFETACTSLPERPASRSASPADGGRSRNGPRAAGGGHHRDGGGCGRPGRRVARGRERGLGILRPSAHLPRASRHSRSGGAGRVRRQSPGHRRRPGTWRDPTLAPGPAVQPVVGRREGREVRTWWSWPPPSGSRR